MMETLQRAYISEAFVADKFGFSYHEDSNSGQQYILLEGEFQRANKPNKNTRIYSEAILNRETIRLIQEISSRNGIPMGMDHPIPASNAPSELQKVQRIDMQNACALNIHLEMQGDVVYGKSKILQGDFSTGDKLAAFVKAGYRPAVSSRGLGGQPTTGPGGMLYVPEDYKMICYDFVTNPSTHNAILENIIAEEIAFINEQTQYKRSMWEVLKSFSDKELQ